MPTDLDLTTYWCWNPECPDYGKRNHGNIALKEYKGKQHQALLYCKSCKKCFSETRGTLFFGLQTAPEEVLRVLALLPEKGGMRAVARLTDHGRNTISYWLYLAGQHAKQVNAYVLRELELTQVQIDEIWSCIKKNSRTSPLKTRKNMETVTP